ncbi:serine/threonine-protein kinase [Aspergillus affinis]|uniref:serine/threonine-protein kinase n=1 Tax=Aspergillus affinis TaxID=1070780 RepID=UPI0022FF29DA|nr:uncharacterized protein KD926_010286 [Aspergillus affinis]KAI9044963.1 hypothetical protein KD926_010286 [Aspergillus affinis]
MARPERNSALAGLKIETSFENRHRWLNENGGRRASGDRDGIEGDRTSIFHDYHAPRCGTDEDNSEMKGLHSATPPISVPRQDVDRLEEEDDVDFPHKPDSIPASPLDSFIQNRRPSVSFDPTVTLDSGRPRALEEPLARSDSRTRAQRFQAKGSSLKNALSPDDHEIHGPRPMGINASLRRYQTQRGFGARDSLPTSPEDDLRMTSEIDHPTSLTSVSTASPVTEELRTPPEGSRGALPSPICMTSPMQAFTSPDDRNSWSGSAITPFGSKVRGPRARHSSRRSTASSGKSPASMFLSMWGNAEEPAPQPDDEGQMVGTDYVLGKQIGFGGFSTVKEAFKVDESGGTKHLAVKVVRKQISGKSEKENDEVQAEFDHEVRVWRYLSHPNVLTLDAVYETDYATFCFTKLAIGGTLFDLVRQNRQGLNLNLAKKYTYQLACALRYLHEDARVVHRDIKLENCLLDPIELPDGTKASNLVLCDFGMSEWMTTDNGGESPDPYDNVADRPPPKSIGPAGSSTSVAGSLEYASPELLLSTDGVMDPSVDIWAFGVIVYATIVGSRPFQDPFMPRVQTRIINGTWDKESVLDVEKDPQSLQDREAALELITGCLEMDVEKRWTVRDILCSRWMRDFADPMYDAAAESAWKL